MSVTPPHPPHTHWPRAVAVSFGIAAVVSVMVLAFLWPAVISTAQDVPVAVAGDAAQADAFENAVDEASPGTFSFISADDRADAVDIVERREVYGAIILGQSPEVLTASAANPITAQILGALAPALQKQLTSAARAQSGDPTVEVAVAVTDVVPLASEDPRGGVLGASAFPLVLGGMLGGILISLLVVGVWRRMAAIVAYAAIGGVAISAIMQGLFGALQGDYLLNAAAIGLALLSIGSVIIGVVSIIGRAGVAVGPVLFLLIANPISSSAQPVEFLPAPWGVVGQFLPPGAASTLLRDLSYFPSADTGVPWLILGSWALAGILFSVVGHFRTRGAAIRIAIEEANEEHHPHGHPSERHPVESTA